MSQIHTSDWSLTAASNNAAVPNGWPENMAPSSVNDAARENMAALKHDWYLRGGSLTSGGSSTAYTLTPSTALSAYNSGILIRFRAHVANTTTTPTLNVSSLGAKTIKTRDGSALTAGDIELNAMVDVLYDGTDFRLLSPLPDAGASIVYQSKTSNFTAVAFEYYNCDTSGGAFTLTLPASPSDGDFVGVSKGGSGILTIGRNSSNINGAAEDLLVLGGTSYVGVIVYKSAAGGWLY